MKKENILVCFVLLWLVLFVIKSDTYWFRSILLQEVPKLKQAEFSTEGPQGATLLMI